MPELVPQERLVLALAQQEQQGLERVLVLEPEPERGRVLEQGLELGSTL